MNTTSQNYDANATWRLRSRHTVSVAFAALPVGPMCRYQRLYICIYI